MGNEIYTAELPQVESTKASNHGDIFLAKSEKLVVEKSSEGDIYAKLKEELQDAPGLTMCVVIDDAPIPEEYFNKLPQNTTFMSVNSPSLGGKWRNLGRTYELAVADQSHYFKMPNDVIKHMIVHTRNPLEYVSPMITSEILRVTEQGTKIRIWDEESKSWKTYRNDVSGKTSMLVEFPNYQLAA